MQNGALPALPPDTTASPKSLSTVALFQLENTPVWVQNPDSHPVKISAPTLKRDNVLLEHKSLVRRSSGLEPGGGGSG
jgi:hypothetical protein